jgi:hypothetical protein
VKKINGCFPIFLAIFAAILRANSDDFEKSIGTKIGCIVDGFDKTEVRFENYKKDLNYNPFGKS